MNFRTAKLPDEFRNGQLGQVPPIQKTGNICFGAGSRQYCQYTKSPLGITPLKEITKFPLGKYLI